jgi:hypothetical protein
LSIRQKEKQNKNHTNFDQGVSDKLSHLGKTKVNKKEALVYKCFFF